MTSNVLLVAALSAIGLGEILNEVSRTGVCSVMFRKLEVKAPTLARMVIVPASRAVSLPALSDAWSAGVMT